MKKRICEIFAVAIIMFSLYHFAGEWKETNVVMQETEKIPDAEDSVVQPSEEVDEPDTEEMTESEETPDFTKQNEEVFYEAASEWGLDQSEAADYYERLCEDNVFGDGIRRLSYLKICDLDENGQKDMVVMVQGEVWGHGEGFIYFYMNEDEAYCFEDEDYPFFSSTFHIVGGDFDCDGNIEIAFESPGTGCGGSGDWYNKILKYKDHGMEKMEFPHEFGGNGIQGIEVDISQEVPGHTYIAYCPYLDETIVFESNHESKDYGIGGGESRGYYNIYAVEYEGRDALVATEYLFAGGHSDCVGYAKFLIVWEKDGSGRVEKWWMESVDEENDPLFDGFAEMDYCLFLETHLDYGVTLDYDRYGIYGDFTRSTGEGEELYFNLNEKMIGNKLELYTHRKWYHNEEPFIQNISPDLEWVISRQYTDSTARMNVDRAYYQKQEMGQKDWDIELENTYFELQRKEDDGTYGLMEDEKLRRWDEITMTVWGWNWNLHDFLRRSISSFDEYGKLLAVAMPDNTGIGVYSMENGEELQYIDIADRIDTDWPLEVSQIKGTAESGWIVFSNGDITYRMTYPDGTLEKLEEFMYATTFSPDEKYLAYCTGNSILDELWMSWTNEKYAQKLEKWQQMYERWETTGTGWYIEELETGKKTYIHIWPWQEDEDSTIRSGRCVWIQKDKLLQIVSEETNE